MLHIEKIGLTAFIRQKEQLSDFTWATTSNKSHLQHWNQKYITLNIDNSKDDRCDILIKERLTNINLNSFHGGKKYLKKAETTVYTDGSKLTKGVGAGIVIYHKNERIHVDSFSLKNNATVFQGEVEAIYQAIQYLIAYQDEYKFRYIKILSDSQAAIMALNQPEIRSKSCLLYTSPSPRDRQKSRMPSSA